MFNARQRRTLRRALQRQPDLNLRDGLEMDKTITEEEKRIVIDVVQLHIGRELPETTDVEALVKILLSLGNGDAGDP